MILRFRGNEIRIRRIKNLYNAPSKTMNLKGHKEFEHDKGARISDINHAMLNKKDVEVSE